MHNYTIIEQDNGTFLVRIPAWNATIGKVFRVRTRAEAYARKLLRNK